jgi:hypothetical protein
MSGKNTLALSELSSKVDELLREYEKSLGITVVNPQIPAEKYLTMSQEEISSMSAEACGEASIILAQYSFYVQRALNIEVRRVNWSVSMIDRTIAPLMKNYNASSASERRMMAIKDNEFAFQCEKLRVEAQARVDQINYLSAKIDALSYRFADLQQTKRMKNG